MQYNTQREHLVMPEYGRGIQNMVDLAVSLPDREARQQCANTIISIMSRIQPENIDTADYELRLWNHLAKISRYKLDIDYPVEIIPEHEALEHPKPLPYPMQKMRRRHYGHLVESALKYAQTLPEGEERTALVGMVANQMKQNLFVWNRDSMDENLVMQDIERYSDGKLQLSPDFRFASVGIPSNAQLANNSSSKNRKRKR
ncbi:MAG: DUF4290 domain-containing protein [Bacteroidaceae bacterium]|nr:DUF4290 domain-containing protein [Bacteroidaceae bacterium]